MLETRLISILRNSRKALHQTSSSFFSNPFSSSFSRVSNESPFFKPSRFFHSKPTYVPSASSIPPKNHIIYNGFTSFLKYHKVSFAYFNYSHLIRIFISILVLLVLSRLFEFVICILEFGFSYLPHS